MLETHVQADHVSGLPELVGRTGATGYLTENAGVEFEHHALGDREVVKLGNTELQAIATPGHALAVVVADVVAASDDHQASRRPLTRRSLSPA